MDDAARVRSLEYEVAFDSYSNERNAGMIASSILDSYLHRNAAHQGFLSQANHVIRKGFNYQQLTEFEAAISTLEQDNGGSMMAYSGVNLSSLRAAKQRARNTGHWGCSECYCWRLTQPETAPVSAQEANVVVSGSVAVVAL